MYTTVSPTPSEAMTLPQTAIAPSGPLETTPASGFRLSALSVRCSEDNERLIALWLHDKANSTKDTYNRDVAWFLAYVANKPLNLVTLEDLQGFHNELMARGLTYTSQRRRLMAVKSLLKFGQTIGAIPINVGKALKLKKQPATLAARILSEADTLRMIHGFEGRRQDALILQTLYALGCRVSPFCALKMIDVVERSDGKATFTIVGKGSKTRYVTVSVELWTRLKQHRNGAASDEPLFPTRNGKHLARSQVNRIITKAKDQAGIDRNVSPHWMRHGHASHALHKGANVKLVKETLGHASLDTTDQYLHVSPDDSSGLYLAI